MILQAAVALAVHVAGSLPFEQVAAREKKPAQRAADGVETDHGIVRKKRHGQNNLHELPDSRAGGGFQVKAKRQFFRLVKKFGNCRE